MRILYFQILQLKEQQTLMDSKITFSLLLDVVWDLSLAVGGTLILACNIQAFQITMNLHASLISS